MSSQHRQTPRLIVLGPQGAGKGTQSVRLSRWLHRPHLAMGDLLRAEIGQHTPLGSRIDAIMTAGRMIPDAWSNAVMRRRLREPDAARGWIVDGYPRTLVQARFFDRYARPNLVLHLHLSDARAVRRLSGRRVCPHGHIYHLRHDPPRRRRGYCDRDGLRLHQRHDDTPTAIRQRLKIYHAQTEPVLEHYRRRGLVVSIGAEVGIVQVYQRIRRALQKRPWLFSATNKTS